MKRNKIKTMKIIRHGTDKYVKCPRCGVVRNLNENDSMIGCPICYYGKEKKVKKEKDIDIKGSLFNTE
jgi:uncharacterized Zn finger protein (UPF0148 family)